MSAEHRNSDDRIRILLVNDDSEELARVGAALEDSGYAAILTEEPDEALSLILSERPDLVLIDVLLPQIDGLELLRVIRKRFELPVILISVNAREAMIDMAYEFGAADYVVKPFAPGELPARIRRVLRTRDGARMYIPYRYRDLYIDAVRHQVMLGGVALRLTNLEYRTLLELSRHAGQVLSYETLEQRVWRLEGKGGRGPMRSIVSSLRRKLGDVSSYPTYIFTQHGVGYRLATYDDAELGDESEEGQAFD